MPAGISNASNPNGASFTLAGKTIEFHGYEFTEYDDVTLKTIAANETFWLISCTITGHAADKTICNINWNEHTLLETWVAPTLIYNTPDTKTAIIVFPLPIPLSEGTIASFAHPDTEADISFLVNVIGWTEG